MLLQRRDPREWQNAEDWLLNAYIEGWAEADADLILSATAPNYCFHDPLVGRFAHASLTRYFTLLHERYGRLGSLRHQLQGCAQVPRCLPAILRILLQAALQDPV